MELLTLFLRTLLMYFIVFAVLRLMGKREIGKLSVFDLVISIMIAELAVFVIDEVEKPLYHSLLPIATLLVVQVLMAYLSLKSRRLRLWFEGKPSVIIRNGKIDEREMKKQRYNLDDLMLQLRENSIHRLEDVEFAVLEPTGKLTIIEKKQQEIREGKGASDPKDVRSRIRYEGLPLPLIMDGKVQDDNLKKIEKTRFWLKNELQRYGVNDFKEVFFCSIDHRGKLFVDKKRP